MDYAVVLVQSGNGHAYVELLDIELAIANHIERPDALGTRYSEGRGHISELANTFMLRR